MRINRRGREITLIASYAAFISCFEVAVAQRANTPNIPLCPGLTIVTAVHQQNGDYESIKTIEQVGPKEVRMKYSAEGMSGDMLGLEEPKLKKTLLHRTILVSDLQSANAYEQKFLENSDEKIPKTTAIGVSSAILQALKSKGEAELSISNAYGDHLTADSNKRPNYYDYMQVAKLRRAGSAPVRLPVIVDDKLVQLPAIRAEGDSFGDKVEFHFLDDEKNPLTLAFRIGIGGIKPLSPEAASVCKSTHGTASPGMLAGGRCDMPNGGDRDTLKVIKINSRCVGPPTNPAGGGGPPSGSEVGLGASALSGASALEKALSETGKVDVYSIYFSFNSDAIREESQPTLKDIAEVMRKHPDWKLRVDGHTDNIGGNEYNLALSKRRSAAVKDAIVKQFGINTARLVTDGHGASQPKDTNDTLEGRARNRRVELVKIG
jgi:outer membrane protein OmpA-like peptidoglycan-associated protein